MAFMLGVTVLCAGTMKVHADDVEDEFKELIYDYIDNLEESEEKTWITNFVSEYGLTYEEYQDYLELLDRIANDQDTDDLVDKYPGKFGDAYYDAKFLGMVAEMEEAIKTKDDWKAELVEKLSDSKYDDLRKKYGLDGDTITDDDIIEAFNEIKGETDTDTEISMYRLYNPNSGEHFYTGSENEKTTLVSYGWKDEGIGWVAPASSETPVYRLYNKYGGEHHYTTNEAEKDALVKAGWTDEGIGWYSDDAKTKPVYREYNPNAYANNHNYTADTNEHKTLLSCGWKDEGIAWYALS